MNVNIYGSSDDLIYIDIDGDIEEVYLEKNGTEITIGNTKIGGLRVLVDYFNNGTWGFQVQMLEEDVSLLLLNNWDVHIKVRHNYSLWLAVNCPDSTPIDWPGKKKHCPTCGQEVRKD